MKFGFNRPSGFRGEDVWKCWHTTHTPTHIRTTEGYLYYKLTNEPKGSGELKMKPDFIHIFNDFIYVYSPGARADNFLGTNDVNRKPLSLCPFVAGLKKIVLKSDFIFIFFKFHHMYIAPGRGTDNPLGTILMTTERPILFAHMLQVSKWYLRNLILYTF